MRDTGIKRHPSTDVMIANLCIQYCMYNPYISEMCVSHPGPLSATLSEHGGGEKLPLPSLADTQQDSGEQVTDPLLKFRIIEQDLVRTSDRSFGQGERS